MKRRESIFLPRFIFIFICLAILTVFISSPQAFAGSLILDGGHAFIANGPVIIDSPNTKQLALKRSYLRMNSSANFALGSSPSGIAFDGANLWVVSKNSHDLNILRANNGEEVIPTVDISANCSGPNALAYDGKNMWVACRDSDEVVGLDGIDGSLAQVGGSDIDISVGTDPVYLLFDGEFMWATNNGADTLSIINTNTLAVETKTLPSVGGSHLPYGMASDGTNIWVVNSNYWPVNVYKISNRTRVTGMSPDQGSNALDVEFDGVNMWITNYLDDQITILKASNASYVNTLTSSDGVGSIPTYLHFDGLYMWVVNETGTNVTIFRAHHFTYMGVANVGSHPQRLAFDGANMWITVGGGNNVVKR